MKYILLSADNNLSVYLVPDEVADHLRSYALEFCDNWLHASPNASKYRVKGGVCYNEGDFILYLNEWLFPDEPSVLVENLSTQSVKDIPKRYRNCECFNF